MPAEVLVMCPACGRPQHAGPLRCVACASRLPAVPLPSCGGEGIPATLETALGHRKIAVRGDRLEWRGGGRTRRFQLGVGGVRELRLEQRPLFESLVVGIAVAIGLALLPALAARLALLPVVLISLAACFLERRYRLTVVLEDGRRTELSLGTCRPQEAADLRRRLGNLAQTLSAYGVSVPQVDAPA